MGLLVAPKLFCLPAAVVFSFAFHPWGMEAQSASEIVRKSVSVNSGDFQDQSHYSYKERDITAKLDADGKPKTEVRKTVEVTMIDGSPYARLLERNGEPLPGPQAQREAAKLNDAKAQRESQSAAKREARISKYQRERTNDHMLMQEMVKAFDFTLAGTESVNSYACYVLDATPKVGYQPAVEKAKVLTGMKGRMWVAKEGYHWVRVRAEVTQPVAFGFVLAKVNQGTTFQLDQAPLANGAWMPKAFVQTVNARILGLIGVATREEQQYFDYQRIDVQNATAVLKHTS